MTRVRWDGSSSSSSPAPMMFVPSTKSKASAAREESRGEPTSSTDGGEQEDADESNERVPVAAPATATTTTALVAAAKAGESSAWAELYRANFPRLYRHVGYLVGDASLAEDLTQEIFARALASLHRFDGRSAFSTWLYGIASNAIYKHWRSRGRKQRAYAAYELIPPPAGEDPEASHLTKQRAGALRAAMNDLPPQQREAFVLLDLHQLSPREAAERLGITPGNLAVRASRARARIRKQLAEAGWITTPSTEVSS